MEEFLSNKYIQIGSFISIPLAFLADYCSQIDFFSKNNEGNIPYFIAFFVILILFIIGVFNEYRLKKLYNSKNIPLPIVFNISNPNSSESALFSLYEKIEEDGKFLNHKKNLEKYLKIIDDDLIFKYDGDIFNEDRFIDFLKIVKHDISQLQKRIKKDIHFHIVYIGPIANAIAIGTIFATDGLTLYQYNKSTDSYQVSFTIEDRSFKESIDKYEIFEKNILGDVDNSENVTVAIDLASHNIALQKLNEPIVHLKSKVGSTLKKADQFLKANKEIYQVLNDMQQKDKAIKLVYSMPVTVGFLLGMSMQTYWKVTLTQFDNGEYRSIVKNLNKIRYYF